MNRIRDGSAESSIFVYDFEKRHELVAIGRCRESVFGSAKLGYDSDNVAVAHYIFLDPSRLLEFVGSGEKVQEIFLVSNEINNNRRG